MKKIYTILFISFFLGGLTVFAATPPALAQETPEEIARSKYSISFPIAELGSCGSLAECRTFCEDPVNYDDCVSYAKSKGFYKEDELSERQETLLDAAESELGCNNIDSCQAVCHQEENFDKCNTFAKKYGISGGHTEDPAKQEIIQKARQTLGCDSPQSCRSFCEKEENRQKCSEFAKQTGLRGGEIRQGPGGCTSEETCRAFCSDPNNYQVCRGFSQGSGGKFVGPGGCNSEESCRAYCQQNPQECGYGTGPRPTGSYNPQEMCLKTPSCKWENNTCQCVFYGNPEEAKRKSEEYSRYCQENPEKCKPGQTGGFDSPRERQKFEEYCRQNPERCKTDFQQSCSPPPSGCSGDTTWDRGTCTCKPQCPAGTSWNGSYCMKDTSGGSSQGSSLSCSPPAAGCGANLTWDQGTCTCKPSCPSGTSWNGTSCMQDSAPYGGGSSSTSSCPPPASGCGADKTWDS
ncbi:hypothetical protein HYW87_03725, partial [Candidatus Roizmanbacteria bacterium]|nr:hypothetical protein [Candidatus Roizmanbacteria bacterium]